MRPSYLWTAKPCAREGCTDLAVRRTSAPTRYCSARCRNVQNARNRRKAAPRKLPDGKCSVCGVKVARRASKGPPPSRCHLHLAVWRPARKRRPRRDTCTCGAPVPAKRFWWCSERCGQVDVDERTTDRRHAARHAARQNLRCGCGRKIRVGNHGPLPKFCQVCTAQRLADWKRAWNEANDKGRRRPAKVAA